MSRAPRPAAEALLALAGRLRDEPEHVDTDVAAQLGELVARFLGVPAYLPRLWAAADAGEGDLVAGDGVRAGTFAVTVTAEDRRFHPELRGRDRVYLRLRADGTVRETRRRRLDPHARNLLRS